MNHAPGHPEVLRIVAPNPGPMTLEGTNTYIYGADPCVVIDPGSDDPGHLDAIRAAAAERGGIGLVLLTHSHADHTAGADRLGAEVVLPAGGESHGGLRVLATPGHAADHVCFLAADATAAGQGPSEQARGGVCFSGDLVLGIGSTIVPPGGGSLAAYMDSLRLLQAEPIELIAPGHGPWVTDPAAKLAEYVEHREMREQRLLTALDRGERSRAALLAEAWSDIPIELLPMAAMAMEAHLEKLEGEGRLPEGLVA
jgi:glyoxylase-like metal-dependent hydrolase (beta-lactamase superfamily II)